MTLPVDLFFAYSLHMNMPLQRTSEKFTFQNSRGFTLAGIIDRPLEQTPRFYAVFAPCFTCLKESHGAVKISRALVEAGGAVLRFDVTGLGGSGGDFFDANFSTRIDDIISAVRAMEQAGMPPVLLIGHSISGTAALSAVKHLPDIKMLATVGSPADPAATMDKFEEQGRVTLFDDYMELVVINFTVKFSLNFPRDMRSQSTLADTAAYNRALMVFHAPNDDIVSFRKAEEIHAHATSAAHREIVKLDDEATHLFEKRADDAVYVGKTLISRMEDLGIIKPL